MRNEPRSAWNGARPTLDLDRFVPYRLSVLTNRVSNAIARHYAERFDLTPPEWRVMAVLGQAAGLSAREVASRTEMDKVQVSRAVAGRARRRRVRKETDHDDGRITRLALTARGRAIYDEIVPLVLALEEQFLAALAPRERAALDALMLKLARRAESLVVLPLTHVEAVERPRFGPLSHKGRG
ncbi:MAG TPA: MarR family transcriptional regulator, partial [Rhizomicrobium sp.]